MIGFNGTYLPAASHGNMRITAASIGGQWVLGNWLMTATQQAIIAAFGAEEGIAVITKTNDYLNRIATTDPQRALQISGFINAYCPTYPFAVLEFAELGKCIMTTNGEAYFNTGVKNSNASRVEVTAYFNEQNRVFVGARNGSTTSAYAIGWDSNQNIMFDLSSTRISVNATRQAWHKLVLDRQKLKGYVDDEQKCTFSTGAISVSNDLFLMAVNNGGGIPSYWNGSGLIISSAKILEGTTEHWYIPVENNKILDAATGNVINKSGNGTATFSYEQITTTPA